MFLGLASTGSTSPIWFNVVFASYALDAAPVADRSNTAALGSEVNNTLGHQVD